MNPTLPIRPDRLLRWLAPALVFAALLAALATVNASPPPASGPSPTADAVSDGTGTRSLVLNLRAALADDPANAEGWTSLGGAYYQRARETGDPSFYTRADDAYARALGNEPEAATEATAIAGQATIALARHDFAGGLELASRARSIAPDLLVSLPALYDAQIELGRYGAATETLDRLLSLKPTLAAYARASYLRELEGDLPGAIAAMRLAVSAGSGSGADQAYVQNLLADLQADTGRYAAAERGHRAALAVSPGNPTALTGLATLAAGRGDFAPAIRRLRGLAGTSPVPEFTIPLAETEEAAGLSGPARHDYAIAELEIKLHGARGENVDTELALFLANHGDASAAVQHARSGWAAAPSVRAADALAWALHANGDAAAASRWSAEAMRLGSRDPMFLYHAGMIARADGRTVAARRYLGRMLEQSPRFNPLYAPRAERALAGRKAYVS